MEAQNQLRQGWLKHWTLVVELFSVPLLPECAGWGWKCQPFNQVFGFSDTQMHSLKLRCSWKGLVTIIKRHFFTLRAPKSFSSVPATAWRLNRYSNYKSQHQRLQGSSMLQVPQFPSFLRLNDTPLYVYTTLSLFIPEIILLNAFFFIYIIWASYMGKKFEVLYFSFALISTY